MKLRRIELPGFGCLRDFQAELAPGLNLFHGLNEAGKSTLQQSLCALLYGFYDHDRARADETARHERFRPWPNGSAYEPPFRGALQYELEDGRTFEVRRDFSSPDIPTQVIDLTTGADIGPTFGRGRHGNVPFARKHLGMSRGVFQSCAFISQGEIFRVTEAASPREIGDAIAALADSGRRDVSAARAIATLDAHAARIGSDRARTADLPRAREHLRAARAELEALDAARAALTEKCQRLDDVRQRLDTVREDSVRTDYLLQSGRVANLKARLQSLREADAALEDARRQQEALQAHAGIPGNLRDEVQMLSGRRKSALEALARAESEHVAAAARVTPDDALEYEALRPAAAAITPEQATALEAIAYQPPNPGLAAKFIAALAGLALGIVRLISRLWRRAPAAQPEAPVLRISQPEAQAIIERYRRFLALRPDVERLHECNHRREAESSALATTDADLSSLLASAGVDVSGGFETSLAAFLEVWRRRQAYQSAVTTAAETERRRDALLSGRSPEELERRLAEYTTSVQELTATHPALAECRTGDSADQLQRALTSLQQQEHELQLAAGTLGDEVRLALDRHRPRAEIEEDIERWRRRTEQLERERAATLLAKAAIEDAMVTVYRDFAPAVNAFLSEGIETVTGGRYRRAHIDPSSLQISLLLPETDQVITNPPVSHGTWSLAYVLMRIGLAQHMSAIGEPVPLVLDDPFVDVDAERLPRILDFLLLLSRRMQVLLFTKDEQVLRWFQETALAHSGAAADGMQALHTLSGRELAAAVL